MLGELQPLALVVRAAFAVGAGGPLGHGLMDQAGDRLAVVEQEGRLAASDLQHRPGGEAGSHYQSQGLKLSKHFKAW